MLDEYKKTQPIAYKILLNSVKKNRTTHAYLFETKGYPKQMDIALAFSKYLLCDKHHTNYEESKDCTICNRIKDGNFTELKIIEPDGLWIKKEQLLELQSEFSKKAVESTKKVYIINHAEKLNASASNSILKFLEEPEDNIVAILLTDNIYQLLDTIVSRCQIIPFKKEIEASNNSLYKLGSLLVDNEEELNNFINDETNKEKIDEVVDFAYYYETKGKDILLHMNKLWLDNFKEKTELVNAFEILSFFYKDVLNVVLNRKIEIMNDYQEKLEIVAKKNDIISISKKLKIILEEEEKIKVNANTSLLMDKLIFRFMEV